MSSTGYIKDKRRQCLIVLFGNATNINKYTSITRVWPHSRTVSYLCKWKVDNFYVQIIFYVRRTADRWGFWLGRKGARLTHSAAAAMCCDFYDSVAEGIHTPTHTPINNAAKPKTNTSSKQKLWIICNNAKGQQYGYSATANSWDMACSRISQKKGALWRPWGKIHATISPTLWGSSCSRSRSRSCASSRSCSCSWSHVCVQVFGWL